MTDFLTKALEWGLGLVIIGVVCAIAYNMYKKVTGEFKKKVKQDNTIKELRKLENEVK